MPFSVLVFGKEPLSNRGLYVCLPGLRFWRPDPFKGTIVKFTFILLSDDFKAQEVSRTRRHHRATPSPRGEADSDSGYPVSNGEDPKTQTPPKPVKPLRPRP